MCQHYNYHEIIIDTSHEIWHNGVAEWVQQEAPVRVCDNCGAMYNLEMGRWE